MIVCGSQLATKLDKKFNNITFTHYRCAIHIINLAVKVKMNYIGNEIKKLHQFVVKVKICILKKVKFFKPILNIDIY